MGNRNRGHAGSLSKSNSAVKLPNLKKLVADIQKNSSFEVESNTFTLRELMEANNLSRYRAIEIIRQLAKDGKIGFCKTARLNNWGDAKITNAYRVIK